MELTYNEKTFLNHINRAFNDVYCMATITTSDKNYIGYTILQSHCTASVSLETFKMAMRIREFYADQRVS